MNVIVCNTRLPMAPQNQSLCGIVFGLRAIQYIFMIVCVCVIQYATMRYIHVVKEVASL